MSLRARLVLLFAALTVLPALPAAWVTHALLVRTVDIGLRADLDAALEAGVRQAREALDVQRAALRAEAARWSAAYERAGGDFERIDPGFADPRVRVEIVQGPVLVEGDASLADEAQPLERGAPPLRLTERLELGTATLTLTRAVDPTWRADALRNSDALQLMRSLRAQRTDIERGFLVPFLLIYAAGLLVALLTALLLARSWTRRVDRLVRATEAVSRGDWNVQVGFEGRDEFARLGQGFDRMVTTLDAQQRHLVDLETMAGWREMARALAHEVKNPLTPIQLTVEEMRERYRGSDPEYRALLDECARIVIEEVESLRAVVTRFREFSRPVELKLTAFDANALMRDIGALQRDLRVEFDLANDLPLVRGDEDRLRQVLMNLASNAREALVERGGGRLGLSTRRVPYGVALVFEDDGPGIPPADRERVFEPYRTGKKAGLGLGLALVKGIVLAHEGSIEVDAGQWNGARFTILLPQAQFEEERS